MRIAALISLFLPVAACYGGDETAHSYGGADRIWTLAEIDGAAFSARATLVFPGDGQVAGESPCNSYSGTNTAPYPWFELGPVRSTRRACPELEAESRFFAALEAMRLVEIQSDTMILSNDAGRQMVFRAAD
ncbi:META domain-containing protein [Sulfitobacter sp. D35]|uniref:META domain-containing protein n=1 Tax=Sulfitobacter sp. D35 TaxID=3083252 RepID=UPI00296F5C07|nr:META domain-containing protein [Sulfitobacter sp. D35]MDW4500522.1 META domain-containing protein [Sulfitobacter sp. D35]